MQERRKTSGTTGFGIQGVQPCQNDRNRKSRSPKGRVPRRCHFTNTRGGPLILLGASGRIAADVCETLEVLQEGGGGGGSNLIPRARDQGDLLDQERKLAESGLRGMFSAR